MKKFLFLLVFWLTLNFVQTFAQNHFIYIQSEAKQSFTVTIHNKQFNSTSTGYVIIPRLKSGQYNLDVTFKDANRPVERFTSVIDKKDLGYLLKDLGNSSAGLINMQTYATLSATPVDSYANNDKNSGITDKAEAESSKTNTTDKPQKDIIHKPTVKKATNTLISAKLKKGINKVSEVLNNNSISLLFIDVQGNDSDTIDVVIPTTQKEEIKPAFNKLEADNSIFKWSSSVSISERDLYGTPDYQNGYNTRCIHLLTKEDYARLRKKMATETNEEKMINEALKVSRSKCFATLQVKNLSSLFHKDNGKYKFFVALYNFVYDYIDYPTLEKEFADAAYVNKLQAMLHK